MINECFLCHKKFLKPIDGMDALDTNWKYDCPRCGLVHISDQVVASPEAAIIKEKHYLLSGILRWRKINGVKSYAVITTYNLEELLNHPLIPLRITDKFNLFYLYMGRMTKEIGTPILLNAEDDYPVTFSVSRAEFEEIIKITEGDKHIERIGSHYKLTRSGIEKYATLEEKGGLGSKQCFVAMNFDNEFDLAYENIVAAIDDCGFKAYRTKGLAIDDVNDLIIAGIKESAFVVAEFTGQKLGVYFEAGFARGLGKKVIWTCREDEKDKLHFDTRQFNHILWKDVSELKTKLNASIRANIL